MNTEPDKLPVAFAQSGSRNTIPVASQVGVTPGAASLVTGFPPLTLTPVSEGGIPPFGEDFNGILWLLSMIAQYSNAGGFYGFDTSFATAIGGYPKGALLLDAAGTGYWQNLVAGNTTDPDGDAPVGWQLLGGGVPQAVYPFRSALTGSGPYVTPSFDSGRVLVWTGGVQQAQSSFNYFPGYLLLLFDPTGQTNLLVAAFLDGPPPYEVVLRGGATSATVPDYDEANVVVLYNGIAQPPADYTYASGSVDLLFATADGDRLTLFESSSPVYRNALAGATVFDDLPLYAPASVVVFVDGIPQPASAYNYFAGNLTMLFDTTPFQNLLVVGKVQ